MHNALTCKKGKRLMAVRLVLTAIVAVLPVEVPRMESLTWTSPRTRATFGTTPEQVDGTAVRRSSRPSTACASPSWTRSRSAVSGRSVRPWS